MFSSLYSLQVCASSRHKGSRMPNVCVAWADGEEVVWSWSVAASGSVAPMSEAAACCSINSLTETGEVVVEFASAG